MINGLVSIASEDLKKADKRGLATLYLYWLENGKKNCFDLPLFVDNTGKGVLSVETFKRVFYAFCLKCGVSYDCEIKSGSDGDESNYNVVRLFSTSKVLPLNSDLWQAMFEEPKKADVKRESSKKTAEKSQAKKEEKAKAEAEAEAENNKAWNDKACKKLIDVFQSYGLRLDAEKMSKLEKDIIKVLETTM